MKLRKQHVDEVALVGGPGNRRRLGRSSGARTRRSFCEGTHILDIARLPQPTWSPIGWICISRPGPGWFTQLLLAVRCQLQVLPDEPLL